MPNCEWNVVEFLRILCPIFHRLYVLLPSHHSQGDGLDPNPGITSCMFLSCDGLLSHLIHPSYWVECTSIFSCCSFSTLKLIIFSNLLVVRHHCCGILGRQIQAQKHFHYPDCCCL